MPQRNSRSRRRSTTSRVQESRGGDRSAHDLARFATRVARHPVDTVVFCGMLRILLLITAFALALAAPASAAPRSFGVYVDPWHVADWTASVGGAPQHVARFEAFSRGATVDGFLRETERQGLRRVLVTWEPWRPVPDELGVVEQFRPQPGYRNTDVAVGVQDAYIRRFAASLGTFRGRVDLRYAHEMNGTWYPWSHDPIAYRRAWRHVVRLVRSYAPNVRFVWSVNPSLYISSHRWERSVRVYWPGRRFVDAVGSTMINFGGPKRYTVARFAPRLRTLRRLYHKPVLLTEVSTAKRGRVTWLRSLARLVRRTRWIGSISWFQHHSRGQSQIEGAGRLDWDVQRDPPAAAALRRVMRALAGRGAARRASSRSAPAR
jgi:mannan endo-1,4-beta-mannosidase